MKKNKIFITGSAGFIGFHLSKLLLDNDLIVHGFDNLSDYYDKTLKENRHKILETEHKNNFSKTIAALEDKNALETAIRDFKPEIIVHLAAHAGVRYSLEHPEAYIESNIVGTFNLLEIIKNISVNHFLMASTSSVYGSNSVMPFEENHKSDEQLTIYSATKKSNESMSHAYSYINRIPTTIFRFFTVYGPWGRPDMALFKFTKGILSNKKIDIYNNGKMYRDFTYIDDVINGMILLIKKIPKISKKTKYQNDSLSKVAPFRILNIGNTKKVYLLDFLKQIEKELQDIIQGQIIS